MMMDIRNTGDGANLRAHVQSSVDEKDELYITKDDVVLTLEEHSRQEIGRQSSTLKQKMHVSSMDLPGS